MLPKAAYTIFSVIGLPFNPTATHLTGAVGSSSANTGNTCDGTTSTPGLSASLVASLLADGVSLPFVLGDALCTRPSDKNTLQNPAIRTVHLLDNIEPDGSGQDRGEGKRGGGLCKKKGQRGGDVGDDEDHTSAGGVDADGGSGGHWRCLEGAC